MPHPPGGQQGLKDTKRRYVVLDRDGTIIVDRHYLSDPSQVELLPRAAEGLRQRQDLGLGLIVITNQSGIGRGLFDQQRLNLIHKRLCELLNADSIRLDGIYVCPHRPEECCQCRKPEAGLLELAAQDLGFAPQACFVIGDKTCDIELGQRVGATTFLLRTGYGAQMAAETTIGADYMVKDICSAGQVIRRLLAVYAWAETDTWSALHAH